MTDQAQRCTAVHLELGQCQLTAPHPDRPHAVSTTEAVLLWNHIEVQRWPSYALPNWVRRLPWAPRFRPPPAVETYF